MAEGDPPGALAGDSWLQARSERGLELQYLERIAEDVESTVDRLDRITGAMDAVDAHALAVLPILRGRHSSSSPLPVVASAYQATRAIFPTITRDAFVEMSSGPGLSLIEDESLRVRLRNFFEQSERGPLPGIVINDNIAYRNAVRRTVPAELQILIREGCPLREAPLSCDLELDPVLAAAALDQLLADPQVRETLNLWAQSVYQERALRRDADRSLVLHAEAEVRPLLHCPASVQL